MGIVAALLKDSESITDSAVGIFVDGWYANEAGGIAIVSPLLYSISVIILGFRCTNEFVVRFIMTDQMHYPA